MSEVPDLSEDLSNDQVDGCIVSGVKEDGKFKLFSGTIIGRQGIYLQLSTSLHIFIVIMYWELVIMLDLVKI